MAVKLRKIIEGRTKLFVPDLRAYKKPEWAPVFYNPVMEKDRSNSVQILRAFLKPHAKIADILCGIGARGVRYAHEGNFDVFINDASPPAIKIAERNAKLNHTKIHISNDEANKFLKKFPKKFDCVDIDPFGSPLKFLESASFALKKGGLICATATDIGTLGGYFPERSRERYGIRTDYNSFPEELGIRNLLFAVQRETKRKINPIAVFAHKHYIRAYVKCDDGNIFTGYIAYCSKCERRKVLEEKKDGTKKIKTEERKKSGMGKKEKITLVKPLFSSAGVVKGGAPHLKCKCGEKMAVFGPTWIGKIDGLEIPYYDLHVLSKKYGKGTVSTENMVEKLRRKKFFAEKSSVCGHGIKTDAPIEEVLDCF